MERRRIASQIAKHSTVRTVAAIKVGRNGAEAMVQVNRSKNADTDIRLISVAVAVFVSAAAGRTSGADNADADDASDDSGHECQ